MKTKVLFILFLSLVFTIFLGGQEAFAMLNGTIAAKSNLDPRFPLSAIRPIRIALHNTIGLCTGTLLNNQTMITAGHCPKLDQDKMDSEVFVQDARTLTRSSKIYTYEGNGDKTDDDFAIVVFPALSKISESHFPSLDLSTILIEQSISFFGVGQTVAGSDSDFIVRVGFPEANSMQTQSDSFQTYSDVLALDGDSGGPLFNMDSQQIIGTVSGSINGSLHGKGPFTTFTRLGGNPDKVAFFNQLVRSGVPLPSVKCKCDSSIPLTDLQTQAIFSKNPTESCHTLESIENMMKILNETGSMPILRNCLPQ